MSNSKEARIILKVVYINKNYPKGAFEAYLWLDGKSKSKQASLNVHDVDVAYEMVDLWAQDRAEEFGLPYVKTSKEMLLKMIANKASRPDSENRPRSILSNKNYFRAEIKRAFSDVGYERIKEVLKEGTLYLNEIERHRNKEAKNIDKAKSDMAKAMYLSYVDTGIDMSKFCSDDEIINEFNKLKEDSGQLI